ncbi:hypothetical protein DMO17_02330 [Aquipseudomonas alcaligenes]|uniref:DUF2334 domain-containing protein n=1 Tax=Aquipseudomonas alcaligenes TaxID=43263 RepID=A0A2V4LIJ0_AQUAC|nr:hypothetical protein [Pseudomonas alcaligenes]PYC29552.1 hypothetical protein DMO17_02330 [Pseudomonas alcaligenes]
MTATRCRTFSTVSCINMNDPDSWEDKVFLTFDIDWAHDEVLADCIDLVEQADVPATWFVTHETPLLARLRANPKFELGIHPNFNFLFNLQTQAGSSAEEVLERTMALVPDATAVRSHHMTQSSTLLSLFRSKGLTHDCNHFIPMTAGITLKPWLLWNDMLRVPYSWEDDIMCIYGQRQSLPDIGELLGRDGLMVFDFHPIHVYLNTENLQRYERTRSLHCQPGELIQERFSGSGARQWLLELLESSH